MFGVNPTWDSFMDAIKKTYHPVGNYDDQYMRWITLCQKRDQTVLKFTNASYTLHIKLGMSHGAIHRYI
jgi:hypothetical protein